MNSRNYFDSTLEGKMMIFSVKYPAAYFQTVAHFHDWWLFAPQKCCAKMCGFLLVQCHAVLHGKNHITYLTVYG
jgi:hypothetical protein